MRSLFGKLFFCFVFLQGMMLFGPPLHAADEKGGLTIEPAFQEVVLDQKNEKNTFPISITNSSNAPVSLQISAIDFGSLDESGGVAFLGSENELERKYALASWLKPEKDVVVIDSGAKETILVTIKDEEALSPGGHYGAMVFKTGRPSNTEDAESIISIERLFSTLVFVKKIGGEKYEMKFIEQEYDDNLVNFQEKLKLRFQNTGNVHLVPRGVVTVTDPLGRTVAKGIINQESALVLPETTRDYPVRIQKNAPIFFPGRYSMEIAYRYDGKNDFTTVLTRFDFVPLPAIVVSLLVATSIGWYVVRRQRNKGEYLASNKDV